MKVLILLSTLAVLFNASAALNCYSCEWYENDNRTHTEPQSQCNDDQLPEALLVDCATIDPDNTAGWQCVKKNGKVIEKDGDDESDYKYVKRYCFPAGGFDNGCKESSALGTPYGPATKGAKCYCNTEKCNSASQPGFGILPALIIIFMGLAARLVQ